jgi:hypothetical protein
LVARLELLLDMLKTIAINAGNASPTRQQGFLMAARWPGLVGDFAP